MIHLTLTGPNAGAAICMAVANGLPSWGREPLPEGDRGVHLAYAPQDMIDGTHPDMCPACVAALKNLD
jgi:hypothetical protein